MSTSVNPNIKKQNPRWAPRAHPGPSSPSRARRRLSSCRGHTAPHAAPTSSQLSSFRHTACRTAATLPMLLVTVPPDLRATTPASPGPLLACAIGGGAALPPPASSPHWPEGGGVVATAADVLVLHRPYSSPPARC